MNKLLISALLLFMANTITAQILPQPRHSEGGMSLDKALQLRKSTREFDPAKELSPQQLSDLLWAAVGINRPEENKLTSPTALNKQEISVYVFTKDGASLYDAKANSLTKVADGDHRDILSRRGEFVQEFVLDAPVVLVMVADIAKFEMPAEPAMLMGAYDAGIVCQNINLFCAANGLATVPRASMEIAAVSSLLNLAPTQIPVLNNPVGYEK